MNCACVCHKVGLFGLLCCPCTMKQLEDFASGYTRQPSAPQPPANPAQPAPEEKSE